MSQQPLTLRADERPPAIIPAADLACYSRHLGKDEAQTLATPSARRWFFPLSPSTAGRYQYRILALQNGRYERIGESPQSPCGFDKGCTAMQRFAAATDWADLPDSVGIEPRSNFNMTSHRSTPARRATEIAFWPDSSPMGTTSALDHHHRRYSGRDYGRERLAPRPWTQRIRAGVP
jgi:hypothetical protein